MTSAEMVKYFYEVVLSGNQLDRIPDFIAPDCLLHTAETLAPLGVEGMREHIRATKCTYPDYAMKITRQFCDGDFVVSEFVMEGTHRGEFLGIRPTGQKLTFSGINIDKVSGGKIIEHGGAVNTFETFFEHHLIAPV